MEHLGVATDCDLQRIFGSLADALPKVHDTNEYRPVILSTANLPQPPDAIATDRLWLRNPGMHSYDEFPIPSVSLCTDKPASKHLGLLILAVLVHPDPATVEIELTHPATQIQHLRVRFEHPDPENHWGLATQPSFFVYNTDLPEKHPWTTSAPSSMPVLTLTNRNEMSISFDPSEVNTLVGFGNDVGSARLAELLLNAGLDNNPRDEYQLEGEPGFRGVGVASSELQIWLPGSLGYDPRDR